MTTFNTLNDISKKQRILFLADSMSDIFNPIAYATNANLNFSADDVDVSNKMDGGWSTSMQGKKAAEVSVDALCAYRSGLTGEVALQTGWNVDKVYAFLYITCVVTEGSDGITTSLKYDTTQPFYYGRMKLSSLDLTSDNGDVCKFSTSGKNQGKVIQAPAGGYIITVPLPDIYKVRIKVLNPSNVSVGNAFSDISNTVAATFATTEAWTKANNEFTCPRSGPATDGDVGTLTVGSQIIPVVLTYHSTVATQSNDE